MLDLSHSFSKVIGHFSAGKIMLTAGYFTRLPAIIYIPAVIRCIIKGMYDPYLLICNYELFINWLIQVISIN